MDVPNVPAIHVTFREEAIATIGKLLVKQFQDQMKTMVTDVVEVVMQSLTTKIENIDRSHRIGRPVVSRQEGTTGNSPKPRDIIIKFATYRSRANMFKRKPNLREAGFHGTFLNEDLTNIRSEHFTSVAALSPARPSTVSRQQVVLLLSKLTITKLIASKQGACLNYSNNLDTQTIHRWSGMDDGRCSSKEIVSIIKNSPNSALTLERIRQTEVLIIDEISMLSRSMFEQVAEICSIKNPDFLFGGMQVIVAGDFYQLPPVPNRLYSDNGEMCFVSRTFQKVLQHKVTLEEIVRQKDATLCSMIRRVSVGNVDDDVITYMQGLNRPLSDTESEPIMLFANNRLADVLNRKRITSQTGELYEFQAKDDGKKSLLEQFTAPKVLWLKIGAPVLLLRNLSQKLVNGLRGIVVKVEPDGPVVHFKQVNVTTKVKKMTFSGEFYCTIDYKLGML
ncbi:uncharacterized protein LOC128553771 [Mercenaria mercenaria]|uniref:uncharacterized protein LOC128553771 n=1 Tax=Mercenaria mercenaria TaxID=6596 RepID=UPI00234F4385|nr:uncharacterized protein LOC128553771 [Mercenaria mercenaria]